MTRVALVVALLVPAVAATGARGFSRATDAQGLGRQVKAAAGSGSAWVAYRIPMDDSRSADASRSDSGAVSVCCGSGFDGPCRLDGADGLTMSGAGGAPRPDGARGVSRAITVEPPSELLVFAHLTSGVVDRLRTFTPDCPLDTGGAQVTWLRDVPEADSAAWLAGLGAADGDHARRNHVAAPALAALSMQAGDEASRALATMARTNPSAGVRGRALFWLAQRAGSRAAAAITDAIANDPDTAVRKRAVFALSQLPKDEGVPLLIQVARTNRNPAVRRQAMFWLGESKDPRAVAFFEEILK